MNSKSRHNSENVTNLSSTSDNEPAGWSTTTWRTPRTHSKCKRPSVHVVNNTPTKHVQMISKQTQSRIQLELKDWQEQTRVIDEEAQTGLFTSDRTQTSQKLQKPDITRHSNIIAHRGVSRCLLHRAHCHLCLAI